MRGFALSRSSDALGWDGRGFASGGPGQALILGLLVAAMLPAAPALAALTLSAAMTPDPVEPGEVIQVALTVTNTDDFDRSDVVLKMRYPEHLVRLYRSYISDGGDCDGYCDTNELLIWNLGQLKAGTGTTVTLPPQVSATVAPGTEIDFDAIEVTDDAGQTANTSRTIVVAADRVLELAVDEVIEPAQPDGELTYILTYGHSQTSAQVNGAVLELTLPSGVSFVSNSGEGERVGDKVRWTLGKLATGQGGQERVVVKVEPGVATGNVLTTQAVLKATGLPNTLAEVITRVESATPLTIGIEATPDPVELGESTQIGLTVSNTSSFARNDVRLTLRYPEHLDRLYKSYVSDGGDCDGYCDANEFLTWNLGTLESGRGITVTLPPQVVETISAGSLISFLSSVKDSSGLRSETGRTLLVNERGLELAIAERVDPVQPGQKFTLDISTGHSAPSAQAKELRLEFPLPEGASFSSASGGGVLDGHRVIWYLGTLNSGEIAQRQLVLRVDPKIGLGSLLASQASLNGQGQAEVRADVVSRVESETPLTTVVEVRDPVSSTLPGDTLDSWLTVENASPFSRSEVQLTLRYPEHLDNLYWVSISDDGACTGNPCQTNQFLTWNFDVLQASGTTDVNLPPVVNKDTPPGTLIQFDALVADSTARSRTEFIMPVGTIKAAPEADLVVKSIQIIPASPLARDTFNVKVKVRNRGTSPALGGTLSVWADQDFVWVCGASGDKSVTVGRLAAGASKTLTIKGLKAGGIGEKTLGAYIDSDCVTQEVDETNNQSFKTYQVIGSDRPDLVVTGVKLTPASPNADGTFKVEVTVENQGTAAADDGYVEVWANQPGKRTCGDSGDAWAEIGNLAAGATRTIPIAASLRAGRAGSKTLRVFADSWCEIEESREGNNQFTKDYRVK